MRIGENKYLNDLALGIWNELSPVATQRVTSKLLRRILLNHGDSTFYNGRLYILHKRSLGAGVYELSLKQKEYV